MTNKERRENVLLGALAICGLFSLAYLAVKTTVRFVKFIRKRLLGRKWHRDYYDEEYILNMHRNAVKDS